jgi:hypothetical protein
MVGSKKICFSETQRPADLEKGKHRGPGQAQRTASQRLAAHQPLPDNVQSGSQTGERGPRGIQAAEPAAEGGRVRDAIRIFERRRGAFPRTMLQKVSLQRLTACDQTVMGVGQRENGKESEGQFAEVTDTAPNLDPVVSLVMSLFTPPAVPDDRIAQALRTASNDLLGTSCCPVAAWLEMVRRKWDKENRTAGGRLCRRAESCEDMRPVESLLPSCSILAKEG